MNYYISYDKKSGLECLVRERERAVSFSSLLKARSYVFQSTWKNMFAVEYRLCDFGMYVISVKPVTLEDICNIQ